MNTEVAIKVENLSKCYQIYNSPRDRLKQFFTPHLQGLLGQAPKQYFREFWALKDVSLEVRKGETFGIIGRNGSGKSTLLQILAGTLTQTSGEAKVNGRIAALLELGSGFNPEYSGRDNVFLNGRILGLSQKEIEDRYDQIVGFADIGEFIDQPVKTYSSGMFVRLAFAVQAHIDASIVIIDEALAVGDVFYRQKCYKRLEQLRSSGAAILLVSHSMPDIEQYCERAVLLDHGSQKFIGASSEAAKHYYMLHQPAAKKVDKSARIEGTNCPADYGFSSISRPPPEAFIDLTNKPQISNGQARCVGVALCDINGQPCRSFRQGDHAVFYYEFEMDEKIDVPICGLTVTNERGVIVHGKSSMQYSDDVQPSHATGLVVCQQEVALDIAPGEYTFQVGIASIGEDDWIEREKIVYEEQESRITRVCHVPNIGSFSVGIGHRNGVGFLSHHGVANLSGSLKIINIPAKA